MATEPIVSNDLLQTGRITTPDPNVGPAKATFNANFSAPAAYAFQFGIAASQNTFGVPRAVFIDNSENPDVLDVSVSVTDQFFPVPAFSTGMYSLDAQNGSTVVVESPNGGATDIVTITFYNIDKAPVVWYRSGPGPSAPISVFGEDGLTEMADDNPFAVVQRTAAGVEIPYGNGVALTAQRVTIASDGSPVGIKGKSGAASIATAANPVPVQSSYLYAHYNTVSTPNAKAGAGVLKGVTINIKGTVASTVTIYDSLTASGTVIAVIDSLNLTGQFQYDIEFNTGLSFAITGTVAPDITVSYR